MSNRILVLAPVILALGLGLPSLSSAKTCDSNDPQGTRCTLHVVKLRPTQFAVGSIAVDCRADKLAGMSKKKLKEYLKDPDRSVPVVVAPDGNFYITDRHHLSTALYRARSKDWGEKKKILRVEIIDNYTGADMSWGEFWGEMQKLGRSYNHDNKGIRDMDFGLLPPTVGGLLNDPYRTLSRWVRESCGYLKRGKEQCDHIRTDYPHQAPFFMEFHWGEFFRQRLPLSVGNEQVCGSIPYSPTCLTDEVEQLKSLYDQAMTLAATEDAKKFLENRGLDPWAYGYNPGGEHLTLSWSGENMACDEADSD